MKLKFEKKVNAQNGYKLTINGFGNEANKIVMLELSSWAKYVSISNAGNVREWRHEPVNIGGTYMSASWCGRGGSLFDLGCNCLPGLFNVNECLGEIEYGKTIPGTAKITAADISVTTGKISSDAMKMFTTSILDHGSLGEGLRGWMFTPQIKKPIGERFANLLDDSSSPYKDDASRIVDGAISYFAVGGKFPSMLDFVKSALNEGLDVRDFRTMGALELIESISKSIKE
ncbi:MULTISPECIES: hypothetical protein [Gammaproteobacteria]|uniref:hypothetical protein n=1 Tax=Gammaproteobacteria TaxID=1236 RepID=UPI002FCC03EA